MRTLSLIAVLCCLGCAHQSAERTGPEDEIAEVDSFPDWFLTPTRGKAVKYPDDAWEGGLEGEVSVDLVLDRDGKVVQVENISGNPGLGTAVVAGVKEWEFGREPWQFGRIKIERLHRVFRFKKSPTIVDFGGEGFSLVTRGYEAPSSLDLQGRRITDGLPGEGGMAAFRICLAADGNIDSVAVLFTNNRRLAKPLIKNIHRAKFTPAKWQGEPIPACMLWSFYAVRRRG